jgi:hypothetical protein
METLFIMLFALALNGEIDVDTVAEASDKLYLTQTECIIEAKEAVDSFNSNPAYAERVIERGYDQFVVMCVPHEPTHADGRKSARSM